MKRFFAAMAAFCFALAALTGCTRHGADCGIDFCVCGADEENAVRNTDSDLVTFDNTPDPVDDGAEDAAAKKDAPVVVVPEETEAGEAVAVIKDDAAEKSDAADAPEVAEAADEADRDADDEELSVEEMARKIREMEASTENEPQIIQDIIDEGYGEVPAVVSEAPAVNVEILPAEEAEEEEPHLQDMAADYAKYLDIESYDAEEPAAEERTAEVPAVAEAPAAVETPEPASVIKETAEEEAVAETPLPPVIEPVIAETKAPEMPAFTPAEKNAGFLPPPPLSADPGPAAFAAEVEPDRSEAAEELTLEGLDDMDLEFFGAISDSLLEDGGEEKITL